MTSRMKLLKAMLKDEKYAPHDYRKIKAKLKSKRDKQIINGIIRQEQAHYRKVKRIIRENLKRR